MNPSLNTFVDFVFAAVASDASERREEVFRSVVSQTSDVGVATLFTHAADAERAHREELEQMRFAFAEGELTLPKARANKTRRAAR